MGRLLLIRAPDGYETTFTYKTFTPAEIAASPRRLLQIHTITDAGGNVATITYHSSQQAGRWVISQININNGHDIIDYTYNANGQIASVSLNSEVKSTYSYGYDSGINAATIVWYERLWTTQARDVIFLSPNYSLWGGALVNQFADVLLARGEGATDPDNAPAPYLRVHRSTGTPGLYRIYDRGSVFEWYRGRYKKYFDYIDPVASDPSLGFSGYVGTFENTYAEHRNASGGPPTDAQVFSGKHPIIVDETGYAITVTYDTHGYVTRRDFFDGSYEKFLYNSKGRLTYYRNRGGYVTVREYDTAGRVIKVAQGLNDQMGTGSPSSTPTATQRIFGYYTSGSHIGFLQWTAVTPYSTGSITPPSADERTDFIYGTYGQVAEIRTPVPAGQTTRPTTQFTWVNSRLTILTNPLGNGSAFTYDPLRRTTQVDYPDGSTARAHYDDTNRIILKQDRVGVVSRAEWNIQGHQISSIGSYGRSTSWPTVNQINDVNNQSVTAYSYLSLQSQPIYVDQNDSRSILEYDYRLRNDIQKALPRSGMFRMTRSFYVDNLVFKTEESFGGYINRTYFGRSADRQTIREISTREQTVTFADNAAILAATRLTGTDPAHAITDTIRDPRGNVVEVIDPIGTITDREYDPVGRNTITTSGSGLSYALTSENKYNGKGQLIEQIDAAGTKTAFTYDSAGNVESKTAAAGTGIAATWTYTYYLDGRQATETQPNSGVSTDYYDACCGRFIGTKNALGHGQITNADAAGRTVHAATVEDFSSHTDPLDPNNPKTLSEVTTKYRDDGRVAATTKWKDPLGTIDPSNPPIAGLGGVSAADGVTTQYLYDNRISDGVGLDSSGGVTIQRLGGGTANVNIQAAVTKLADTVANGGAGVTFISTRSGKATVAISPDEKTMNVSIQDAVGRTVFQGLMTGPAATTPNQLVSWTCTAVDKTYDLSGVGLCEAVWQISQDGKDVRTAVDGFGNQVAMIDQLSKLTRMKYNSAGSLIQQIDALSQTSSFEYDLLGRQTKAIDPQSNASETIYHATTGRVTSRKDPKNQTASFTYDVLGRVLTTTDRTGKVTTQTYTNMGQVATVTDAESRATGYGYNVLGQRISTTYSDSGQQTIDSFDAAGRPLQITKPSGRKHHLTYNFLGNVTQIQFKNSAGTVTETQTMTYDAYGRETGVASSQYSASTAKTYNDLGQLASESTTYSSQTYTVGYAYDAQGRLNQMTYPSGKVAAYTFDARQQLKTISWQGTQIEDRSYNDIGLLTNVDRAYVDETRSYNTAGRVTTINSNNVGSMTYSYDANGNVTGETLSGNMANYSFTTVSGGNSGYDGEDRFMRFIRSGVSEDIQLTRSHIGNISNVNLNGGNTARGFNNAHGLTTVTGGVTQTYDSDGNTTKLHTNVTASWDDAGRTKNTNTPTGASAGIPGFNEYGYVGGLRIWKKITRSGSVVEHRVTVHAGPNVIAEYNAGATASSPVQEYVYADQIDSLVLIHRSNGTKLGVSRNRQWSVVALHDLANGNVVERYAYEMTGKRTIYAANGTTVRSTSSYGNHFGYTSRWHDEESGLMYFRARYYNPLTGEFLSRDPLEFVDGMSLYRGYFPINGVDPTGKLAWFIPIIAWFVVGAGIEIAIQMWNGDEFNILAILASGAITAIPGGRWGATGFKALRIRELLKELRQNIFEWRYTFGNILDGTSKMHFRGLDLIYHRQKVRELIRQVREAISDFWATVRAAAARSAARSATTNAIKSLTGNNTDSENAKSAESKSNPVSGPQRPYVYSQPIIDGLGQNRFVLCIPTTGRIIEVFPGDALPPGTPVPPQWPGHPGHGPIYQPIPQLPPNIPNNGDPSRRPGIPQLLPSIPSHGFPPFQPPPNIGS